MLAEGYRLEIMPFAREDIRAAMAYYVSQQLGLSHRFIQEIEATLYSLLSFGAYEVKFEGRRCIKVKKFPYLIYYLVEKDHKIITIVAVLHERQDSVR